MAAFGLHTLIALCCFTFQSLLASDVEQLTAETFDSYIGPKAIVLVEFYEPFYTHHEIYEQEIEVAASNLKHKSISLARVDCSMSLDLCEKHGIFNHPSFVIFQGLEEKTLYSGLLQASKIESNMIKWSLPLVSSVTPETFSTFKAVDEIVVIGFFDDRDAMGKAILNTAALRLRYERVFGSASFNSLAKAAGLEEPSVVVYRRSDQSHHLLPVRDVSVPAIIRTIQNVANPLIGELDRDNYKGYEADSLPLGYIFAETASEREQLANDLEGVASLFKSQLRMVLIDASPTGLGGYAPTLGLPPDRFPSFAIQNYSNGQAYPLLGNELSLNAIETFIWRFVNGTLSPGSVSHSFLAEQAEPSSVTVVTSLSFEDVVMDKSMDVLINFYAPWCHHCRALEPTYAELAELYVNISNIAICKMDGTANDLPEKINGFPTIKIYPAGADSPAIEFSGSQTIEGLAKFILENGKHKIDVLNLQDQEVYVERGIRRDEL